MNGFEEFKYFIFESRIPKSNPHLPLHNQIFEAWRKIWSDTFVKSGSPSGNWLGDFIKHDLLVGILSPENEVVAVHMYTFHNLKSLGSRAGEYLSIYSADSLAKLEFEDLDYCMSAEYLGVAEKWRRSKLGFSFSDVLLWLSVRLAEESGIDAVIGTPIKLSNSHKNCELLGCHYLESRIFKYGYELAAMYLPLEEAKAHPDPLVNEFVEYLWQTRIDTRRQERKLRVKELEHGLG